MLLEGSPIVCVPQEPIMAQGRYTVCPLLRKVYSCDRTLVIYNVHIIYLQYVWCLRVPCRELYCWHRISTARKEKAGRPLIFSLIEPN